MGLLDLFSIVGVRGAICCTGNSIEDLEQVIMNDAKSENKDLTHNDEELNQDKEIDNSKEM